MLVAAGLGVAACSGAAYSGQTDPAHALAQKFSEAATQKPPPQKTVAQSAEDQRAADEKEMLERARAEAEARRAADQKAPVELKVKPAAPAAPAAAAPATPAAVKPAAAPTGAAPKVEANAAPLTNAPAASEPPAATTGSATRASILLVLNPGQSEEKRATSKASPILCLQETCYVSGGAQAPAKAFARAEATRSGASAGDCIGKPLCVFRGVALPPQSFIQIVDLGPAELIRMETIEAKADTSCMIADGTLVCEAPITAPDYRMWLVPEPTAEKAGAAELEAAVADELPEENIKRVSDK